MELRGLFESPRFTRAVTLTGALTVIFLLVNIFVIGGDGFYNTFNTLVTPLVALAASVLAYKASTNRKDAGSRSLWSMMAWGYGLWTLAELIWGYQAIVLGDAVPFPSVADLAWVCGYLPLYGALISRLRALGVIPSRRQVFVIVAINGGWLALTAVSLVIPILQDFDSTRMLEGVINLTYPLANVGLLALANIFLILMRQGRYSLTWRLIFIGILITTISDLLFSYANWNRLYYPDDRVNALTNLIDTSYTIAYLTFAMGIFLYRRIWEIGDKTRIRIETMPADKYYAFVATDERDHLITVSDNLFLLVNARPDENFYHRPMREALGMDEQVFQSLMWGLKIDGKMRNERAVLITQDRQERAIWITALAFNDPQGGFSGANFAISAEIRVPEELRLPKNGEIFGMMNYLLDVAGSRREDEVTTMQVYFTEVVRLLSSCMYQFGGEQFRAALFDQFERAIRQNNLPVRVTSQSISFPALQEGSELAPALIPLLRVGVDFARNVIGEQVLREDILELERPLTASALHDLNRHNMRVFPA